MTKHVILGIGVALMLIVSSVAEAQEQPVPKTPEAPIAASKSAIPPGAEYLSRQYGISMEEAAMRINLQAEIASLVHP